MKINFFYFFILVTCTLLNYACDSNSPNEPEESTIDWTETPQSCSVQFNRDTLFVEMTFKNWSWSETDLFIGQSIINTITYNGLDEPILRKICDNAKKELNNTTEIIYPIKVTCKDNVISSELISNEKLVGINTPNAVASRMNNQCNQLLSGKITLKDIL